MISNRNAKRLTILAAALALAACGKQEQPPPPAAAPAPAPTQAPPPAAPPAATAEPAGTSFSSVDLGTAVDATGKLTGAPATTFAPNDTIYAVVMTTNSGTQPATIAAHWTFQGTTTVNDSSQTVTAGGPSVTNFHIEKPGGFPAGDYSVAISIDGKEVAKKDFTVAGEAKKQ